MTSGVNVLVPDLRKRKIVVFGAAGFIGRHVVARLQEGEAKLVAFDRARAQFPGAVEYVVAETADVLAVRSAARGCDTAIFLAGRGRPNAIQQDLGGVAQDIIEPLEVARECRQAGVGRFVFASSGGTVYGANGKVENSEDDRCAPVSSYGAGKLASEHFLRIFAGECDMHCLSLRVSNPYGEGQVARGQGFIAAAMQKAVEGAPLEIWGDGTVVRDFVHIRDVADAFARATSYEGSSAVVNIGSGIGQSLNSIIFQIKKLAPELAVHHKPSRDYDIPINVLDIRLAAEQLDWRPRIDMETGLQRTLRWWRSLKQ